MTKLRCAGDSDPGLVRTNNEDRFYSDAERGIFLVVDGIGGQAAGEQAAEIAVRMVRSRLERKTGTPDERLREAIAVANNEILTHAGTRDDWRGMACVLTAAVIEDGAATIGHVGDSRLYKIRRGKIEKLTHDHSPVGEREDSREISEAEAMRHPRRNEVYRDVGSEPHSPQDADFIEIARTPFESDSALLLCSDGLSDQVPSQQIRETVERNAGNPHAAVRQLIAAANQAGGKDNVTVLIVEGERFAGSAVSTPATPPVPVLFSRWAMFVYGAVLAAVLYPFVRPAPKPVIEPPRVLTVGQGGTYANIATALAQARPGDTVDVLPGEYREQVTVKAGVAVRSRVPWAAVLRGAPATEPAAAVVAEKVKGARVEGFRIASAPDRPLALGLLIADSDIEAAGLDIVGAGVGIEIRGDSHPTISGNSIHDSAFQAVLIGSGAAPRLAHNAITGNGRDPAHPRPGVTVLSEARPALVANVFDNNGEGALGPLPPGVDPKPLLESNFFIDGKTIARPAVPAGKRRPRR